LRKKLDSARFPKFSNGEYSKRNRKLKELMERESLEVCIIYGSPGNIANLYYWTHYITKSQAFFVTDPNGSSELFIGSYNHIPTAREMSVVKEIEWIGYSPIETIVNSVKRKTSSEGKGAAIGLIGNPFPFEIVSALESQLGNVRAINVTQKANEIRAIKSQEESDWLRKGAQFTDRAMRALEEELKIGMTEHEIVDIIERAYIPLGGTTRIHYLGSTPMDDPKIYVPAQYQSSRRIKRGDVVLTELSAEYGGYAGQIHRPVAVGMKPTENYLNLYETARATYDYVLSALRDGATAEELVRASDKPIIPKGYTICDSLVHGFGTDLSFPSLGTSNSVYSTPQNFEFKQNMAIVIQPNPITLDKKFGLQLGNLCLVGKTKSISLQKFPIKFITTALR
jgi:Xaa-Pro dipeptidase